MHHTVLRAIVFAQFVNLGVAVVAAGDAVVGAGGLDLLVFKPAVFQTLLLESGLQKTAAAAAAVIVGSVGLHVDKIFFPYNRLDHKTQVFCDGIAVTFTNDLARILNGEFDLQVLVPVAVDLEFALADPLGVVFVDVFDDEVVFDVELFQSCQD